MGSNLSSATSLLCDLGKQGWLLCNSVFLRLQGACGLPGEHWAPSWAPGPTPGLTG